MHEPDGKKAQAIYIYTFFYTILEQRADISVYTITQLLAAQLANTQVPDSPTAKIKEL